MTQNNNLLAQQQQEKVRIEEQLAKLIPEAQSNFIKKWGLDSVISDLKEYFGPNSHVDLERMWGKNPAPNKTGGLYNQEDVNYLLKSPANKLAVVVWCGDPLTKRGYEDSSGRRISFSESQNGDLFIIPGDGEWSLDSCPMINHWNHSISSKQSKQVFSNVQDAILNICENRYEYWSYSTPEPTYW